MCVLIYFVLVFSFINYPYTLAECNTHLLFTMDSFHIFCTNISIARA